MKKNHGTKRTKAQKSAVKDLAPRKAGQVKAGDFLSNVVGTVAKTVLPNSGRSRLTTA
jgi:hypothetical protein